jgi:hypothetical protein
MQLLSLSTPGLRSTPHLPATSANLAISVAAVSAAFKLSRFSQNWWLVVCPCRIHAYCTAGNAQTRLVSSSVWCLVPVVNSRALETLLAGPLVKTQFSDEMLGLFDSLDKGSDEEKS